MSTISSFKNIQNRHDVYRGKDCIKKFCKSLREHALEIINFKKKKMKLLGKEQQESCENGKTFVKKNLKINMLKVKNIVKLGIIVSI